MIKIAQIGIGYWGPNLLRNAVENVNCVLTTAVDLSAERRDYVKKLYPHIKVTENSKEVFCDPSIDGVIISTPVRTHFTLAMDALQAGKHVLVEKPMATTVEEIDELHKAASRQNLILMAGHTFLFSAAVRYLKHLIDQKELGAIRYIYSHRLNLGRIRSDVDALWNFAPHDVSIIQFLLNNQKPTSITRQGMDFIQNGIDDVVFLTLSYPEKIFAHIHVSWLDPRKVRQIVIVGSKKMVLYDDVSDDKIAIYNKGIDKKAKLGENMDYDERGDYTLSYRSGDLLFPKIDSYEPLKAEIQHFISCIEGKEKCITGPDHAREVVRILQNAKRIQ